MAAADEERWTHSRNLVSNSFTKTKLKAMTDKLDLQASNLVASMAVYSKTGQPFYPRGHCKKYALNIVLNIVFSENIPYDEDITEGNMERLAGPIDATFKQLASANPADFITTLSPFYMAYKKFIGVPFDVVYQFTEEIYDQHVATLNPDKPRDLFDLLIIDSEGKEKESVIHIATDFVLAGTDTSASTIEWFTLLMCNHQEIQEKAYAELISVVGAGNKANLSHRIATPYINAVIKEVLRFRPIAPLGLPRIAKNDIVIDNLKIPRGTQMILNHFALHHDESYWPSPEVFMPERFLTESHTEHWLPFSIGKRNCVGKNLAEDEIYLACANIILSFRLKSATGKPIPDKE
eukprot:gene20473-24566_t